MQGRLQQSYRVSRELDQHATFDGTIPLSKMPRLSSLIIANETDIEVKFEFASDAYQHPSIRGSYRAQLNAQCQRCLEPMDFTVEQDFELLIDASDEEVQAFQVDSVYTSEGYLDVFEVIEDELILTLPIILMHDDPSCNEYLQPGEPDSPVVEKNNPFAVLEALKEGD